MAITNLINALVRRGAVVRLEDGDKLRVKPASALTNELRAKVRERKAEIVAFLIGRDLSPVYAPRTVTCTALERGLEVTSFGWPKVYCAAEFAAELEAANRAPEAETQVAIGGAASAVSSTQRKISARVVV